MNQEGKLKVGLLVLLAVIISISVFVLWQQEQNLDQLCDQDRSACVQVDEKYMDCSLPPSVVCVERLHKVWVKPTPTPAPTQTLNP